MTAKEKAKELLKRFLGMKKINPESITRPYNYQEAKQCLLICVQDKIEFIKELQISDLIKYDLIEYQEEVQQEIEKL